MKFWKRKAPWEEAQDGPPGAPVGTLEVRPAIEEHLVGIYGDFSALEMVACLEPGREDVPGLMVFTRFRLPPARGGRGVAVFYFPPQSSDVFMFNMVTSGVYVVDSLPPEGGEEEVHPTEEPVKTILGMRVAASGSEPDRR